MVLIYVFNNLYLKFEVFRAVKNLMVVFWVVTPCCILKPGLSDLYIISHLQNMSQEAFTTLYKSAVVLTETSGVDAYRLQMTGELCSVFCS
jgi:hypothetical protein